MTGKAGKAPPNRTATPFGLAAAHPSPKRRAQAIGPTCS